MAVSNHVIRRRGRYWFRVRVPTDLIDILGRREVWRTLRTADPVEAKQRGRYMATKIDPLWNEIRNRRMLTKEQIDQLVREYFDLFLEQDQVERYSDKPDVDWKGNDVLRAALALPGISLEDLNRPEARRPDGAIHGLGLTIEEIEAELGASGKPTIDVVLDRFNWITHVCMQAALKMNDWREAELFAQAYIAQKSLPIDKDSEDYRRLCFGLLRAVYEATGVALARSQGDWSRQPRDPFFRAPAASPVHPASPIRPKAAPPPLSQLVEKLLAEKKEITKKFKDDHRAAVRAYEQTLKNPAAWHLAETQDVAQFKDMLLETPANWTKLFPGKSLAQAIEMNRHKKRSTLSTKTINEKYLRVLNAVLRWAKQNGYSERNAAEGVRVETAKKSRRNEVRYPFAQEQLAMIFRAPLYTGCASSSKIDRAGSYRVQDHRFWAPLIALFTGARANEIGQLRKSDVVQVDGIPCIQLHDHELKTEAASRLLPIHPTLIGLGFLDLAKADETNSPDRLFPTWAKGKDGYYSSTFSKWFARFLDSVEIRDRKQVFHSFRHNFKDALRVALVPEEIQNRLMGHSTGHVGEIYGHGYSAKALHSAIEKISFDGIDFDALAIHAPAKAKWD